LLLKIHPINHTNTILNMATTKTTLFTEIENIIGSLNIDNITYERRAVLKPLIDFIQSKVATTRNTHQFYLYS